MKCSAPGKPKGPAGLSVKRKGKRKPENRTKPSSGPRYVFPPEAAANATFVKVKSYSYDLLLVVTNIYSFIECAFLHTWELPEISDTWGVPDMVTEINNKQLYISHLIGISGRFNRESEFY
jgi:hypothetical protein